MFSGMGPRRGGAGWWWCAGCVPGIFVGRTAPDHHSPKALSKTSPQAFCWGEHWPCAGPTTVITDVQGGHRAWLGQPFGHWGHWGLVSPLRLGGGVCRRGARGLCCVAGCAVLDSEAGQSPPPPHEWIMGAALHIWKDDGGAKKKTLTFGTICPSDQSFCCMRYATTFRRKH